MPALSSIQEKKNEASKATSICSIKDIIFYSAFSMYVFVWSQDHPAATLPGAAVQDSYF